MDVIESIKHLNIFLKTSILFYSQKTTQNQIPLVRASATWCRPLSVDSRPMAAPSGEKVNFMTGISDDMDRYATLKLL